jgi:hypothetical protein
MDEGGEVRVADQDAAIDTRRGVDRMVAVARDEDGRQAGRP